MRFKDMLQYQALYAPDDGSGGGGDTGDTGAPAADAGQTPQYVTQEAFTEQFKSLQDGLFSMVRKMNQSPESPKQPAPQQKSEPAKPDQQLADMQARIDFLEQAPKGLAPAQQKAMFDLYRVQQPEDRAAWFESTSKLFALEPAVKPENVNQPAPASDAGAPKSTSANETDPSNVTQWSKEDWERQFALKAPVPHNRYDIRNREFHREVRRNAEKHMANTRIALGANRKG
jgi:hypothetical protein